MFVANSGLVIDPHIGSPVAENVVHYSPVESARLQSVAWGKPCSLKPSVIHCVLSFDLRNAFLFDIEILVMVDVSTEIFIVLNLPLAID